MIETNLLKKYIAGDASQQEKETVQLWLEADKKNMKEFLALRKLYDITLANLDESSEKQSTLNKRLRIKSIYKEALKIAATVIVAFGLSYTLFTLANRKEEVVMQSLYVPSGQRAELTLADGTVVWLNAQTKLTFPSRFDNKKREVQLDGEGYFKVAKDESQKFIVNTKHYDIAVLGTEFNVSAYNKLNNFETSLLTGSVEVTSRSTEEKVKLSPGERVAMENNKLITKPTHKQNYFLWKDGILSFDQERIEDILNKCCLVYDMEMISYNKPFMDVRQSISFYTKDGIEHVLNVLKIATGLQYKKDDEKKQVIIW